jgi:hypothetical protein
LMVFSICGCTLSMGVNCFLRGQHRVRYCRLHLYIFLSSVRSSRCPWRVSIRKWCLNVCSSSSESMSILGVNLFTFLFLQVYEASSVRV